MDLLIVASPTDLVARAFERHCASVGLSAQLTDLETAARLFSIEVEDGAATVDPDIPLFLRMPPPKEKRDSFDDAFLHGESFATLFAAAALCKSTVINRPFRGSLSGMVTQSTSMTELRGAFPTVSTEVFSDTVPQPALQYSSHSWCVQDLGTFHTAEWPAAPNGAGPYRAKSASREAGYEMVTVLGQDAWRATKADIDHLNLETKSVQLVAALQLMFAVATWVIPLSLDDAALVRVDPYPSSSQLRSVWPLLGPALVRVFFDDIRRRA